MTHAENILVSFLDRNNDQPYQTESSIGKEMQKGRDFFFGEDFLRNF